MIKNRNVRALGFAFLSHIISFTISAAVTFIVPRQIGVLMYGWFQLYLFYANYVGFLGFGLPEGIYLRYGGERYNNLDKSMMNSQFRLLAGVAVVIGAGIAAWGLLFSDSEERLLIIVMTGATTVFALFTTFFAYILDGTNCIRESAMSVIVGKTGYAVGIGIALVFQAKGFVPYAMAFLAGIIIRAVYLLAKCKDILLAAPVAFLSSLCEAKKNIVSGISLMVANVSGMLIIGLVRWTIGNFWGVSTFGKVSLTISVTNLLMVFIRAIALIMFPLLRRTDEKRQNQIYCILRTCIMTVLFGMLVFYYPLKIIMMTLLPQYADSLAYMALLLPMCIFESKMSMLIETYLKALRKERWLLMVNVITVALSALLTGITVYGLHNLDLAIFSIVALLAFRCAFAEMLLSRTMNLKVGKDIVLELGMTAAFIISSWFVGGITGVLIYAGVYLLYIFKKKKDIFTAVDRIVKKMRKEI